MMIQGQSNRWMKISLCFWDGCFIISQYEPVTGVNHHMAHCYSSFPYLNTPVRQSKVQVLPPAACTVSRSFSAERMRAAPSREGVR